MDIRIVAGLRVTRDRNSGAMRFRPSRRAVRVFPILTETLAKKNDACSLSRWERVGVRGYSLNNARSPSPGAFSSDLSPTGRGDAVVRGDSIQLENALTTRIVVNGVHRIVRMTRK